MIKRKNLIKFFIFVLAIILLIILWSKIFVFFSDLEKMKSFIMQFGFFSPIIFILLVMFQVMFAPIPGQFLGFIGGYLFGAFLGVIYSMIGLILGSFIVFTVSRKFGKPFVKKIISKKIFDKFEKIVNENGKFYLFMIYLLPALPDDAISYIAGLSNIKIRNLVIISAIGRLPGFIVLSIVGAGFASQNSAFSIILFIILMIVSLFLYLYNNKIEKLVVKILKKLEKTKTIYEKNKE